MLQRILDHLEANPGANSHEVAVALQVPRTMLERFLELMEDEGRLRLERPATCLDGPACATSCGPASKLGELTSAALARKASVGG